MSETLPGTWDKFVNQTDNISYPQEAYFHGKKIIIKKVKCTVLLSDTEDPPPPKKRGSEPCRYPGEAYSSERGQ